jgi:hypothetical protein
VLSVNGQLRTADLKLANECILNLLYRGHPDFRNQDVTKALGEGSKSLASGFADTLSRLGHSAY